MFSNALKSFSSNISSNYTLSQQPTSTSPPWKIYDAKKKSTGKAASVFVFDKKSLEPHNGGSLGGRSNAASLKRAQEEVLERLKKEANSLARLRHPSILELVEPVEETRNGGLQFATEPVTVSLAGLLQEKDDQERAGGVGGRRSRYVVEESDGQKRRRELEIDELEIQKGLLQISKGLEFLHESAGLVHANLTPEAIFVNAKSDWKLSGLGFSSPAEGSNKPTSVSPISLSEVLNNDPRLPRFVQLNLDYTSPDFVLDGNITAAADMFSLGLLIIALYNSPHRSPLEFNGSQSAYKRAFSSSSSVPTQSNNFMASQAIPRDLVSGVLPRLITRRPAQRLSAREFQEAQYFDNILVSTIRFLDSLPAKTPNEKSQFMRGLPRILNQFPKSVLEKKVLPALLEETKDRDLLALVLQNVFKIVATLPASAGKRVFVEKVIPKLRETFLTSPGAKGAAPERDSLKEAGLMVVLENMSTVADSTGGKEFKDDILPIIVHALDSPTHALVDAALGTLSVILNILDFSTVKNELFPVIASVFAKTSSMGIKIRGLEALRTLCGGSAQSDGVQADDFSGMAESSKPKASSTSILDKYTVQEKVVPLLRGIKTKEPAVMMAALDVFKEVGKIADSDFLALEGLPILWSFSLGPLLNLQQFQAYMTLIKSISSRIEQEQTRKLQELGSSNTAATATRSNDFMNFGSVGGANGINSTNGETDFEALVRGNQAASSTNDMPSDPWATATSSQTLPSRPANPRGLSQQNSPAATFSWSTPPPTSPPANLAAPPQQSFRTVTPDQSFNSFTPLQPSTRMNNTTSSFSQPLQPNRPTMGIGMNSLNSMSVLSPTSTSATPAATTPSYTTQNSGIDWSRATGALSATSNPWSASNAKPTSTSSFSIPPPPSAPQQPQQQNTYSGFGIKPPPAPSMRSRIGSSGSGMGMASMQQQQQQQQRGLGSFGQHQGQGQVQQKQGLDKYESLI